ncbi:recombination regulator RecX [Crenobacter sp. SG2305]|uniref:recombination regulator RecX n=1 Tax=Crenobacter oryzisoli TaxID=3056844 RepID=UPI0025AA86AC|nr:recombination regulator RecX [Crenobacter sp. SG2305]MDN0084550.1 recombination regulator RecX [Crenobacter sp. SG2305]
MTGKSLRARALDLLSRREYSRVELARKLAPHADSAEELDTLLAELTERGWQSDSRFAEQFSHVRSQKYGARRVAQELRMKGVDDATIRELAGSGEDEFPIARAQWQKKFGQKADSPQEKAKQMRFLAARGFSGGVIRRVLEAAGDDDDGMLDGFDV